MSTDSIQPMTSPENLEHQAQRFYYLDNLRALALMLGIFFHAALAYSLYMNEFWLTAAPEKSTALEFLALFSHLFRMPLFMLIAGFFAHSLYQRHGTKGFIKNRSIRIVAPFFIFMPLLFASYVGLFIYAMGHVEQKSPLIHLVSTFATNPSARPNMPMSTMHLWFLFNLILFYCATLVLVKINLFSVKEWLSRCTTKHLHMIILLALPLLVAPSFYSQSPIHMPDRIYPQLYSFGYYGVFFAVGWILFSCHSVLDSLSQYWKAMLIVSCVAFALVYHWYPRTMTLAEAVNPQGYTPGMQIQLPLAILRGFISVYMVLTLLVLGKQYLNRENAFFRYLSQSSYWVYLVHVPIILFIQLCFADRDWNMWLKYVLCVTLTFLVSLLSYQLLVRYTPIGWMLNGRKE